MGFYFTDEHRENAYSLMSNELFEEGGLDATYENKFDARDILGDCFAAINSDDDDDAGLCFYKRSEEEPSYIGEFLQAMTDLGYLSYIKKPKQDIFIVTEKLRELFEFHFPADAMLWEPDFEEDDDEWWEEEEKV